MQILDEMTLRSLFIAVLIFLSAPSNAQSKKLTCEDIINIQAILDKLEVSDIRTPCDCTDAMENIVQVLYIATDFFPTREQAQSDIFGKTLIDITSKKTLEVAAACGKLKITDDDMKQCPSFKSLEEKAAVVKKRFGK